MYLSDRVVGIVSACNLTSKVVAYRIESNINSRTSRTAPETLEQATMEGIKLYLMITRIITRPTESRTWISLKTAATPFLINALTASLLLAGQRAASYALC